MYRPIGPSSSRAASELEVGVSWMSPRACEFGEQIHSRVMLPRWIAAIRGSRSLVR